MALTCLEALVAAGFDIAGVMTRPPARRGRSSKLVDSPVGAYAKEKGLPLLETSWPSETESLEWIRSKHADLGVVVAYGALLKKDVLESTKDGWVNLHFSKLPDLRGAAPVQRAVLRGDKTVGTTVFFLDEGMDTGPILSTEDVQIAPLETSGQLLERLAKIGGAQLVRTVAEIEAGSASATPQPDGEWELAPKLTSADGFISFQGSAEQTVNRIRAVSPAPGAWTSEPSGRRLKLADASITEFKLDPGEVAVRDKQLVVGTGTRAVALGRVAPAGKTWMNAADWLRGARVGEDYRLGTTSERVSA